MSGQLVNDRRKEGLPYAKSKSWRQDSEAHSDNHARQKDEHNASKFVQSHPRRCVTWKEKDVTI